jgi:hypothetical protein
MPTTARTVVGTGAVTVDTMAPCEVYAPTAPASVIAAVIIIMEMEIKDTGGESNSR